MTDTAVVCSDYDATAHTCTVWTAAPDVTQELFIALPTIADAQVIGWAILVSWVSISTLMQLFRPRKELD